MRSGKTPIVLALWAHHDGRMNRILTSLPLPPRLRDLGWGVLLVPALLLIVNIFSRGIAWVLHVDLCQA